MLLLLSPAKTLDYQSPLPSHAATTPKHAKRALELIDVLRRQDADELAELMTLSAPLAQLNVGRYRAYSARHTAHNSRPAMFAFNGNVYEGLDAASLDPAEVAWAQQHLAILSGLYGVLRPLDRIQPHRLEMGTRLATLRGRDLYSFWGSEIARTLDGRLRGDPAPCVVNLASDEYFRAVDRESLRARVTHCVFEEWKDGTWKVIGVHAKRARGLMARHAIRRRAATPEALLGFDAEGYVHHAPASEPDRLVFRRRSPRSPSARTLP